MGFDLDLVVRGDNPSDLASCFKCNICLDLVDLNCVATKPCSHLFCRECLVGWLSSKGCTCPTCNRSLIVRSHDEKVLYVGDKFFNAVRLLEKDKILDRMLKMVHVKCPMGPNCSWEGCYGDVSDHLKCRDKHSNLSAVLKYTPVHEPVFPAIKSITVSGAGTPEMNGTYYSNGTLNERPRFDKDFDIETKWGTKSVRATICAATATSPPIGKTWYISILDADDPSTDKDKDFYSILSSSTLPPLYGWTVPSKHFLGKLPAPILTLNPLMIEEENASQV